ncbi:unnamed protein product [Amoebophrya sp. A25]|nr:unnamed protein product [Amoebophrya sp. A25]|eukprot:GSA25T00015275001.1
MWLSAAALVSLMATLRAIVVRIRAFRRFYEDEPGGAAMDASEAPAGGLSSSHTETPSGFFASLSKRRPLLFEALVLDVPFSLYFGWTTAASIVSISLAVIGSNALLATSGGDGDDVSLLFLGIPQHIWAVLVLYLAAGVYFAVLVRTGNVVYPFVCVWAAFAIADECRKTQGRNVRSVDGSSVLPSEAKVVEVTATVLAIVVLCAGLVGVLHFVLRYTDAMGPRGERSNDKFMFLSRGAKVVRQFYRIDRKRVSTSGVSIDGRFCTFQPKATMFHDMHSMKIEERPTSTIWGKLWLPTGRQLKLFTYRFASCACDCRGDK